MATQNDSNISLSEQEHTTHYMEPRWIAGEIMLLLIMLVTIYIFVALMYYSWRFRHMARVSGSGQELRERYLHYSCAAVILIAIVRCALHQVVVFLPKHAGSDLAMCKTMLISSRVVYNLAIFMTYVHLWLRQHMFYTKTDLKSLRTKSLVVIDWSALVIIICTSAVLAFIAFIPIDGVTAQGAYRKDMCNAFEYTTKPFLFLYAGLSFVYQLILVGLYIYPIIVQRFHQKSEKTGSVRAASTSQVTGYPALWMGVRRGFTLTVIVIVTDATFGCVVWYLSKKYPELLSSIIALNDVNLIINVVCCICTFRNWRKIVFGLPACRRMGWHNDDSLRSRKFSKQTSITHSMALKSDDMSVTSDRAISAQETMDNEKILNRITV